jgi:hypothetical protein
MKYLMESAGLTYKRMPCINFVAVEASETAILEWCLHREEDANAGPSSLDDRLSDQTSGDPFHALS